MLLATTLDLGGQPVPLQPFDGAFDDAVETVRLAFPTPADAGLHELCVRKTDDAGNTSEPVCTSLPVYEPDGGFATGGGWIATGDSPRGKLHFTFVSRYGRNGFLPEGGVRAWSRDLGLDFASDHVDWLVVSGSLAIVSGSGALEGSAGIGTRDFKTSPTGPATVTSSA